MCEFWIIDNGYDWFPIICACVCVHRQVPNSVGGGYFTCICHGGVSLSIKKIKINNRDFG